MNNKQYVIFDLDGTLIDSWMTVANACKRVFAKHAPDIMPNDNYFLSFRSTDMEQSFAEMAEKARMPVEEFRTYYDEQYAFDCITGTKPIKQQYERLIKSKKDGLGIIVLTNKKQYIAELICSHFFLKEKIDIIMGWDGVTPIKPQLILEKMRTYNINPQTQCLMYYGDSEVDLLCAELLGVPYTKIQKQLYIY